MAWQMRTAGMLMLLAGMLLALGCTTPGAPSKTDKYGPGVPMSPVGEKKTTEGQPVARGQQPGDSPTASKVSLVSSPAKSELPAALVAEKYEVRICAWVNGKPIFKGDVLNEAIGGLIEANRLQEPA